MFDERSKSSLEAEYFEDVHRFNYVPRTRYISIQTKEAKRVLRDIRKMDSTFNIYSLGAI